MLTHFSDFSSDLLDLIQLAEKEIKRNTANVCIQKGINKWELDIPLFLTFEPAMRRQVMQLLFNQVFETEVHPVGRKHQIQMIHLIESIKPNSQVDLPGNWVGQKSYQKLYFFKRTAKLEVNTKK